MDAAQALIAVDKLYEQLANRRPTIEDNEAYFNGSQPLAFATPEWSKLHQARYRGFSDNWCGVVGSAPAERTTLEGFGLGADTDALSNDEKSLWFDWESNDGPAQSSQGFQTSTVARRSFALVWGNRQGEPQLTWEHPSQVIVQYNPESRRERVAALKSWIDGETEYATLYTPSEVWKFQRKAFSSGDKERVTNGGVVLPGATGGGGWTPRQPVGDDTWPLRNPLKRVPIVEFPNRPSLALGPVSDIEGTKAMQDAINLLWAYLFVAADYASMPARIVLNASPPKVPILNEVGEKVGEKPVDIESLAKGRMLWVEGDGKADQWDAARLDVFTDTVNVAVKHVAAQTRTPIYLIHGELGNVNGETLTGLDAPLVAKVRESQAHYTSPVREVFSLMAAVRGNNAVATAARAGVVKWNNPALASDAQIADAAIKARQVGFPLQAVLERVYGYSPTEVQRILDMVEDEGADPYLERVNEKDAVTEPEPSEAA